MRILIIHTGYKVKGGEDSVVSNETNLLRSAGHEVELLLFSNAENTLLKILQLPYNYSSYKRTKEAIGIFKPDLVHIHNLHFGGSASVIYAVKKSNLPLVVTLHNYRMLCPSGTLFYNGEQFMSSLNTIMPFKAIGKGVYQNSKLITLWLAVSGAINQVAKTWEIPDRYILLGNNAKDMFLSSRYKHLAAKMEIKPNFCYEFKAEKKEDKGYYLYIGRLSPEKGIQVILNAFSKTDLSLKIVGSGPLEAEIISYANTHQQISFLGMKNKYEVYDLISSATAVIFSSLWHETFGMVIIEAFAGGTPVIASSIGEAKNLVNNKVNGLLFEAGNENDLFEKVLYYQNLTNEEKIKYRNNALETYKENYTPEANLSQLMDIYQLAMKDKDTD